LLLRSAEIKPLLSDLSSDHSQNCEAILNASALSVSEV